jgi:hypothetical protein
LLGNATVIHTVAARRRQLDTIGLWIDRRAAGAWPLGADSALSFGRRAL